MSALGKRIDSVVAEGMAGDWTKFDAYRSAFAEDAPLTPRIPGF